MIENLLEAAPASEPTKSECWGYTGRKRVVQNDGHFAHGDPVPKVLYLFDHIFGGQVDARGPGDVTPRDGNVVDARWQKWQKSADVMA